MLRIDRVSASWTDFRLRDIELEVKDDEYFVVLGPSGSGKSLLLETIAGFYPVESGHIHLNQEDITALPPNKRDTAVVYQDYVLFPHMNVRKNIGYGLNVNGISEDGKVDGMAERLGIDHLLERDILTLSGGEKQRVAIARALVLEPKLLLMDEPYGSLDNRISVELRSLVKNMHDEIGGTVIHVTHDQEEAVVLGDNIGVMKDGRIVQSGKPEEVMRKPISRYVAEFVGTGNIFHGEASKKGVVMHVLLDDSVKVSAVSDLEGKVVATIRPEDIILANHKFESSARNAFDGIVNAIIDRGIFLEIRVNIGIPLVVYVTRQAVDELALRKGSSVVVLFKASAVHLFHE